MLSVEQIIGFESLGKREKETLELACKHAQDKNGKHVVDALDTICRKAWGKYTPSYTIASLERKGFLINLGKVLTPGSCRKVKRHQIVLNPERKEIEIPKSTTDLTLELKIGNKPNQKVFTFPIDSSFRLSISGKGFGIDIKAL